MRIITINGSLWNTVVDFYRDLLAHLGAPADHGFSVDAFVDSMIYGGMLEAEPPYKSS